ncbi:hypothetical protein HDV63DRAFT_394267 [Trichoderma sp. SZMC 28014]
MESQKDIPTCFSTNWRKDEITEKVKEICSTTGIVGMSAAHLKDFRNPNAAVPDNTTIADLLGHRTGLQAAESVLIGYGGRICLPRDEIIGAYHNLKRLAEPRSRFIHGAINYALLEEIVNECCPEGYWEYLKKNVWGPSLMYDAGDERERFGVTTSELYFVCGDNHPIPLPLEDHLDSDLAPDLTTCGLELDKALATDDFESMHADSLDKALPTNDLEPIHPYSLDNAASTNDFEAPPSYCKDAAFSDAFEAPPSYSLSNAFSTNDFEPVPFHCKDEASLTNGFESLPSHCKDKASPTCGLESLSSYVRQKCQGLLSSSLPTYRKQQAMAEKIINLQQTTMKDTTRGMAGSLYDLINFCKGLNQAADKSKKTSWARVYPDVDLLFNPLQAMEGDSNGGESKNTRSYAAGWATTTLPGKLEGLGINSKLVSMPVIGLGQTKASKVYWNQGVHNGSNCFVALLPETKSAVIVLTNTRTANDAADWIGQFLLESLLGGNFSKHLPLVKTSHWEAYRQNRMLDYKSIRKMKLENKSNFWGRPLDQYVGMYASSSDKKIKLIVWPETYKGFTNATERFELQHLEKDTFTWLNDWGTILAGGKSNINYPKEHYKLHFHPCKHNNRKIGSFDTGKLQESVVVRVECAYFHVFFFCVVSFSYACVCYCFLSTFTIIRVLITSLGVVTSAARAPAIAALDPATRPVSNTPFVWSFLRRSRLSHKRPLAYSNMGNWSAVKGKLRATSAVYPENSPLTIFPPPAMRRNAANDVDLRRLDPVDSARII